MLQISLLEGMFSILLYHPLKTVEKTAEEIIIGLIQIDPKVTIKEMTKATGLTH